MCVCIYLFIYLFIYLLIYFSIWYVRTVCQGGDGCGRFFFALDFFPRNSWLVERCGMSLAELQGKPIATVLAPYSKKVIKAWHGEGITWEFHGFFKDPKLELGVISPYIGLTQALYKW